jgi:hypothetical protein
VAFVELDPEIAWRMIQGFTNELDPQRRALEAFYRQFRCKRCQSPCRREMLAHHAFADPDTLVPRCVLRCVHCALLFDPHTGLVLEAGRGTGDVTGARRGSHRG